MTGQWGRGYSQARPSGLLSPVFLWSQSHLCPPATQDPPINNAELGTAPLCLPDLQGSAREGHAFLGETRTWPWGSVRCDPTGQGVQSERDWCTAVSHRSAPAARHVPRGQGGQARLSLPGRKHRGPSAQAEGCCLCSPPLPLRSAAPPFMDGQVLLSRFVGASQAVGGPASVPGGAPGRSLALPRAPGRRPWRDCQEPSSHEPPDKAHRHPQSLSHARLTGAPRGPG